MIIKERDTSVFTVHTHLSESVGLLFHKYFKQSAINGKCTKYTYDH